MRCVTVVLQSIPLKFLLCTQLSYDVQRKADVAQELCTQKKFC